MHRQTDLLVRTHLEGRHRDPAPARPNNNFSLLLLLAYYFFIIIIMI